MLSLKNIFLVGLVISSVSIVASAGDDRYTQALRSGTDRDVRAAADACRTGSVENYSMASIVRMTPEEQMRVFTEMAARVQAEEAALESRRAAEALEAVCLQGKNKN